MNSKIDYDFEVIDAIIEESENGPKKKAETLTFGNKGELIFWIFQEKIKNDNLYQKFLQASISVNINIDFHFDKKK